MSAKEISEGDNEGYASSKRVRIPRMNEGDENVVVLLLTSKDKRNKFTGLR